MRKLFYFALFAASLLLLNSCIARAAEKAPADEEATTIEIVQPPEVKQLEPPTSPVVRIVNTKGVTFCTGFLVAPRYIATAGHCLVDETDYHAVTDNGIEIDLKPAIVADSDFGMADFALAFMTGLKAEKWKAAPMDCSGEKYPVGTEVYTRGFPGGEDVEITSKGFINGALHPDPSNWIRGVYTAQMPVFYGNSGGPVWNAASGEVLGILVGTQPMQRAWSYIQPIKPVCEALNG